MRFKNVIVAISSIIALSAGALFSQPFTISETAYGNDVGTPDFDEWYYIYGGDSGSNANFTGWFQWVTVADNGGRIYSTISFNGCDVHTLDGYWWAEGPGSGGFNPMYLGTDYTGYGYYDTWAEYYGRAGDATRYWNNLVE